MLDVGFVRLRGPARTFLGIKPGPRRKQSLHFVTNGKGQPGLLVPYDELRQCVVGHHRRQSEGEQHQGGHALLTVDHFIEGVAVP
ncbi:hypothetical protein D9M71_579440 [compost metagenome]